MFITQPDGSATSFRPTFTYPIFGDSEQIYGYKDLIIYLCFDHYTFYPFLNVKFSEKLDGKDIVDPKEKMLSLLPESTVYKDEIYWQDKINEEKKTYQIPGVQVGETLHCKGEEYVVYRIDMHSKNGIELQKRLQILVLLFIEAGSYIDYGDSFWDIHVMYKVTDKASPSIVGFCTAYSYWKYGGSSKFDAGEQESRKKISQFIILPPYQGIGLGGLFYIHLYSLWLNDPTVVEVVVEDPNESFDDLRDRCDLQTLSQLLDVRSIDLPLINSPWAQQTRRSHKLEKRQFSRLLEMILLYQLRHKLLPITQKQVRLFIKRRLYNKNKDVLESLDEPTRRDKLQTAYISLEQDYYRILDGLNLTPQQASGPLSKKKKL